MLSRLATLVAFPRETVSQRDVHPSHSVAAVWATTFEHQFEPALPTLRRLDDRGRVLTRCRRPRRRIDRDHAHARAVTVEHGVLHSFAGHFAIPFLMRSYVRGARRRQRVHKALKWPAIASRRFAAASAAAGACAAARCTVPIGTSTGATAGGSAPAKWVGIARAPESSERHRARLWQATTRGWGSPSGQAGRTCGGRIADSPENTTPIAAATRGPWCG